MGLYRNKAPFNPISYEKPGIAIANDIPRNVKYYFTGLA
jgi:hypothetical protein